MPHHNIPEELLSNPVYRIRVDQLDMPTLVRNCLKNDNVVYVGEAIFKSEVELLRAPNFGKSSLKRLKLIMASLGVEIGRTIPDGMDMMVYSSELEKAAAEDNARENAAAKTGSEQPTSRIIFLGKGKDALYKEIKHLFRQEGLSITNGEMPACVKKRLVATLKQARLSKARSP